MLSLDGEEEEQGVLARTRRGGAGAFLLARDEEEGGLVS
jgi:hypothetical protein